MNDAHDERIAALTLAGRKLAERISQLEQAVRELDALSYFTTHDLNHFLHALGMHLQKLVEEIGIAKSGTSSHILDQMLADIPKMTRLADRLLLLAHVDKKPVKRELVVMNELFREVYISITSSVPHKASVSYTHLVPVIADKALIEQVLVDLLSNAIKYSSGQDKPSIHITAIQGEGEVIFSVADNGIGFDMQDAEKLFDVKGHPGTGLGLVLVQRIVQRHKGRVWASASPDSGATFYFSLPAA